MDLTTIILVALLCFTTVNTVITLLTRKGKKELEEIVKHLATRNRILENQLKQLTTLVNINQTAATQIDEVKNIDQQIWELYIQGYSVGEISRRLGISKPTVSRRLNRIRKEKQKQHQKLKQKQRILVKI